MQELWHSILGLLSQVVIPDWGELIKLIPLALLAVVILFFLATARMYATAGPTRRAPARLTPIAPPELHMPGPSYAPILLAIGVAAQMWGLVVGGDAMLVGLIILALTLLYWGREAITEFDRATSAGTGPAIVHAGPPPGVHMPGPSFRPILGALGMAALLSGLVFGGWVLAAGLVIFVTTLVGWLPDARAEFDKAVEADMTGHLENPPAPRWPRRLLQFGAALFVLAVLLQTGVIPPKSAETASGGAAGSPGPSASAQAPATAFTVVAKDIAFDTKAITVPASAPYTIAFDNQDTPGITHDIEIRQTDGTTVVEAQPVVNGGEKTTYTYKGLPAGNYIFICSIHPVPSMTGTLTVK